MRLLFSFSLFRKVKVFLVRWMFPLIYPIVSKRGHKGLSISCHFIVSVRCEDSFLRTLFSRYTILFWIIIGLYYCCPWLSIVFIDGILLSDHLIRMLELNPGPTHLFILQNPTVKHVKSVMRFQHCLHVHKVLLPLSIFPLVIKLLPVS